MLFPVLRRMTSMNIIRKEKYTANDLTKKYTAYDLTKVSFYSAVAKFSNKTTDECVARHMKTSHCLSKSYGRCIQTFHTAQQLAEYLVNQTEPIPFLSNSEYVFDYERELLKRSSLKSLNDLPSLSLSKLTPHNVSNVENDTIRCSVGDVITIRADLVANNGNPRTSGYDDVRGWMVDTTNRRAAANVVDLKNGSYDISFKCLWPLSKSRLNIGVAYPREYLYLTMLNNRKGITRFTAGQFIKDCEQSEVTPCFATPNIPWPCLCNFTTFNNASFYCGRPTKLTCSDLHSIQSVPSIPDTFNKTTVEAQLMNSMSRSAYKTIIKYDLFLQTGEQKSPESLPSCRNISPKATWLTPHPQWYRDSRDQWQNLLCKVDNFSKRQLLKCFNNSKIMIIGDSNGLRTRDEFVSILKLGCHSKGTSFWNFHTSCKRPDSTMELTFDPHEYHLYLLKNVEVYREGGVAYHIDTLPNTGRHLVLVHYYLHTMGAHLSVLQNRLLLYKSAIKRALARNPLIVFAFRGPHISQKQWTKNHAIIGDTQGIFYLSIVKDVFKDLLDNVFFLDGWGMSIAVENEELHPSNSIPQAMAKLLISFVCES